MKKRKVLYVCLVSVCLTVLWAGAATAQDVIYISEPNLNETPKMLPRMDAPLWDMDYKNNPALLTLDRPYEFIDDAYYLGSAWKISSEAFGQGFDYEGNEPAFVTKHVDINYLTTVVGTDAGFVRKLNDRSNLAIIANYRYGNVNGDGNFFLVYDAPTFTASHAGTIDQNIESHDFSLSALYSMKITSALTFGAGLKYTFRSDWLSDNLFAQGFDPTAGHDFTIDLDRDLRLSYHIISPTIGVSIKPSGRFNVDGWLSAGFYFGDVRKNSTLFENTNVVPTPYRDDIGSHGISGWDVKTSVRPEIVLSDTLSVPFVVDFSYRDLTWRVGGPVPGFGFYAPFDGDLIFHGPGLISYKNEETIWLARGGAGLKYNPGWAQLSGMLSYTHWDFRNAYGQSNPAVVGFLTAFGQLDTETRDIAALDLTLTKDLSDIISADFSARYLVGWAHRRYEMRYSSPYEISPPEELRVVADDRDTYQNLILSAKATLKPASHLSLSLMGSVAIPLDSLDYRLEGRATGLNPANFTETRDVELAGPVVCSYESSGWEWGTLFSLTYEFGCPTAAPPAAPVAPMIEPKLEPMSER